MDIIVHSVTEKKNKRRITSQSEFYSFGPVFHDDKEKKKKNSCVVEDQDKQV